MVTKSYAEFLQSKFNRAQPCGFKAHGLPSAMKPFQADSTDWFCYLGRAGCFAFTGAGKSLMELAYAEQVVRHANVDALILCPLAVAAQTLGEAEKFGIGVDVTLCREPRDIRRGINLLNYERLHKIDPARFGCVSCDEASILKHIGSKTREQITESFRNTPYKLPATATPAPNDHMELGNQAEFCGWMSRAEMLATYFVHDSGQTAKWRLRKHAESVFWKWMASWALMISKPSDLGYSDDGYILPPLTFHEHIIETESQKGWLFPVESKTLADQRTSRRDTIADRAAVLAKMVNASSEPWVVWCELNDESETASRLIPDSVEVTGSQPYEEKEEKLLSFVNGQSRVLVSKASICGFGINMQRCNNVAFLGIDHSYESYYQAIRRCWRFGQTRPVNVHLITSDRDAAVLENIKRKEADHERMMGGMVDAMKGEMVRNIHSGLGEKIEYKPAVAMELPSWLCC